MRRLAPPLALALILLACAATAVEAGIRKRGSSPVRQLVAEGGAPAERPSPADQG